MLELKRGWRLALGLSIGLLGACSGDGGSSPGSFAVQLQRVFPNLTFDRPLAMFQAPGDAARFYLVEQGGSIWVFDNDPDASVLTSFFTDSNDVVEAGGEAGLLGMAFHPDYPGNATVYLSYTRDDPAPGEPVLVSYVSRYTVVNGSIDSDSEDPVLTVDQPFSNHNGGQIAFGLDGYLYIGLGDGGSGGDPRNNGQDTSTLLGAMLRIDVDGAAPYAVPPDNPFASSSGCNDAGCPEIFAWGLRNPWRWSFDSVSGDLWLGDVGQNAWEEVNLVRNGENYGWRFREGAHCFMPSNNCPTAALVDPRAEYDHSAGASITGGYVYRGSAIPALSGHFLYGDYISGRLWALDTTTNGAEPVLVADTGLRISSFAQDQAGELYILDYGGGGIHKLEPAQ